MTADPAPCDGAASPELLHAVDRFAEAVDRFAEAVEGVDRSVEGVEGVEGVEAMGRAVEDVDRYVKAFSRYVKAAARYVEDVDRFVEAVDRYVEGVEGMEGVDAMGRAVEAVEGVEAVVDATGVLRDQAVDLGLGCTSATRCAVCLQHKTTPLYNDELGGHICLACIDSKLIAAQERVGVLTRALKELLIFAGHYAKLLNMHDGGARRVSVYEDIDAWLETLTETGVLDRT